MCDWKFVICLFFWSFGFVIIAPTIILIDNLLKTFKFAKKEAPGSENETS